MKGLKETKEVEEIIRRLVVRGLQRGPVQTANIAAQFVEGNAELWARIREALALARLETLASSVSASLRRQPIDDDRQMPIPGFENIPLIVRVGNTAMAAVNTRLPEVDKLIAQYKRSTAKSAADRLALRELLKVRTMMAYFAPASPRITLQEAILRTEEYEIVRARRVKRAKKGAAGRWKD